MKRSKFLKYAGFSVALPGLLGKFSVKALANVQYASLLGPSSYNDNVLVVIQMLGGNDGLNMVIPLDRYTQYANARPNIAIPQASVLGLTGSITAGLHPGMTGMQAMYGNGKLAIVQAAGYPNSSQSHFTAQDIWMSGNGVAQAQPTGWLGRYLDSTYDQYPDQYPNFTSPHPLAIQIGSTTSLSMEASQGSMGINVTDPNAFYNLLNNVTTPAPATNAGNELTFLRQQFQNAASYTNAIRQAALNVVVQATYPNTYVANSLKIVAKLIKGGLKTKVYIISASETFDTHVNQVNQGTPTTGTHANTLTNVSNAIATFQTDCQNLGIADRVMGMTFSEFGRRIMENGSVGTDHGAAAPMFVFGNKVVGGIIGNSAVFPGTVNSSSVVPYQNDYRSVYQTLLQNWLCLPQTTTQTIMGGTFAAMNLVQGYTCSTTNPTPPSLSDPYITCTPSIFGATEPEVKFFTAGGPTKVELLDSQNQLLYTIIDSVYKRPDTQAKSYHALTTLPSGNYYLRYQNDSIVQTIPISRI